ncbi:MAG: HAD-IB family phosphatase [Planctomycetota bacterium]|nr:HAD-IB family phosphatase [Planctomycetota bacterium]
MGSVIFDFDSTLVPTESLEDVLSRAQGLSPEDIDAIREITDAGMEGRLSFEDSLRMRLGIAAPTLEDVTAVAHELASNLTGGAEALVRALHDDGHQVWIVSGGLREILEAVGSVLGIPRHRIHGVTCRWSPEGTLDELDPDCGFSVSKVEGLRRLGPAFDRPAVGVGDGATDLALRSAGFVDRFVAYTEHAERAAVVAGADATAGNMTALGPVLGKLLL